MFLGPLIENLPLHMVKKILHLFHIQIRFQTLVLFLNTTQNLSSGVRKKS